VLADRYRLEEHIHDDSTGRQVWRGVDVILRRPVTIVLKYPGGDAANDMLQAAVAASRVVHPHTVGVYDAVDEGERAYVVREFIDGRPLSALVAANGPLDPVRATAVAYAIADALAAIHDTGVAHGNVHPDTVLLGSERIVLADARADADASQEGDIRGLGGVLYCALTGTWPTELPGDFGLPPAPLVDGKLAAPRQVRANVPNYIDALAMDLLDEQLPVPTATELSGELGRLNVANEVSGPLDLVTVETPEVPERRPRWKKLTVGIAGLAVIAILGLLLGTKWLNSNTTAGNANPNGSSSQHANGDGSAPTAIKPAGVRIVDPDQGDRTELADAQAAIDDSDTTEWKTQDYKQPNFGNFKRGMGVLLDLGKVHDISTVSVVLSDGGATVGLRMGSSDPANGGSGTTAEDNSVVSSYKTVPGAAPQMVQVTKSWTLSGVKTRYLMVWITSLPQADDGGYQLGVKDIKVRGQ